MSTDKDETYTIIVKGKPLASIKADLIHAFLSVSLNDRTRHVSFRSLSYIVERVKLPTSQCTLNSLTDNRFTTQCNITDVVSP